MNSEDKTVLSMACFSAFGYRAEDADGDDAVSVRSDCVAVELELFDIEVDDLEAVGKALRFRGHHPSVEMKYVPGGIRVWLYYPLEIANPVTDEEGGIGG